MEKAWRVEIRGVRGAAPIAHRDFLEYGGNTSCILVKRGEETVILDAGSGLLEVGKSLSESGRKRVHILLSHLHMDHVCGLFGFPLFLDSEAEIHLYGRGTEEGGLQEQLEGLLNTPWWPLGPADFRAHVEMHELDSGMTFPLAGLDTCRVRTLKGNHPGGSLLYRLEDGLKSIVYGLDCEMDEEMSRAIGEFARKASLLIWDANFTEEDLERCRGWGHSSWRQGIRIGKAAEVEMVLMTHYSREYTDAFLRKQQEAATGEWENCRFAREGMVIEL